MSVEIITGERISQADSIVTQAISAASEFAEVFVDLSGVQAPLYVAGQADYAPAASIPGGLPGEPDAALQSAADAALAKIDSAVNDLDQNITPEVDGALADMESEIGDITAKLAVLSAMADNIVIPSANDFMFSEEDFRTDNDLDALLKSIIETEIRRGGEGYSEAAEDAAYEKDGERREIARQEAIDAALDEQATRGFSMPQGFHLEAVTVINEKFRLDDRTRSKDIMIAQSKLSLDNKWRAIDAGISYNQIVIAFYDAMAQRALDAALAVSRIALDAIKYRVAAALKQVELAKAEIGAVADGRRADIERYAAGIQLLSGKINGLLSQAKGYISAYRTDGQIFGSGIEAAARQSRAAQGENLLALETQQANIITGISAAKNALRSYLETAALRLGAAQASAQMQKANAMGALESLDTVVQLFKSGEITTSE